MIRGIGMFEFILLHNPTDFIKIFPFFPKIQPMERQVFYTKGPNRIQLLKEKGRYDEAAEEIRQGLEKDPHDPFLKTSMADLYLRQGRLLEGRILAEEVLGQDPPHPPALSVLGDLYLKGRSPQKALECYRQALNRDQRPYLILKAARALKEMGNLTEALEELEKVLVINPENVSFLKEERWQRGVLHNTLL